MALSDKYERFYRVEWLPIPGTGNPIWGPEFAHTDGELIMGLFVQRNSDEIALAGAQGVIRTIGQFSCDVSAPTEDSNWSPRMIRRARDSFFFTLVGDAVHVPQALSQFKVFNLCEITDRPTDFIEGNH